MINGQTFYILFSRGISVSLSTYVVGVFQVTTKRDRHYAHGPPFDTISGVGRMQVVGRVLENFLLLIREIVSAFSLSIMKYDVILPSKSKYLLGT